MRSKGLFLSLSVSLALIGSLDIGKALAWSPLQWDVNKDVEMQSDPSPQQGGAPADDDIDPQPVRHHKKASAKSIAGTKDAPSDIDGLNPNLDETSSRGKSSSGGASAAHDKAAADKDDDDDDEDKPAREKKVEKPILKGIQPNELTLDPNYYLGRAQGFVKRQDYQSALNYVSRSLELAPENWNAYYEKALIYQLAGYDAAAARRYLSLIQHCPDMIEPHISMGTLYCKHNNLELAVQEYNRAIEINYYSYPAHFNLANVLMGQSKLEPALKEYKLCLKLKPKDPMVHNNLGIIYQKREYYEEAAEEFQRACQLAPANPMFVKNLDTARTLLSKKPTHEVHM